MCSVTPKARTSTAAMDTGVAQRRAADGFASARREAARIAASSAALGSSRDMAPYALCSLSPASLIADRFLQFRRGVSKAALRRLLVGSCRLRDLRRGEIAFEMHEKSLALREGKRRDRLRQLRRRAA